MQSETIQERLISYVTEGRKEYSRFVLALTGPTASGKTSLAIDLAKELDGEIISCDSMQLYRGMDIGTAKPNQVEQQGIPHHMIDVIDPWESYSVVSYQQQANALIHDILRRGKLPIVAGGTGLYLCALTENYEYVDTQTDPNLRQSLQRIAEEQGTEVLHAMLQEEDPEAASHIHPNNVKRVIRALEAYRQTGFSQAERNEQSRGKPSGFHYETFVIARERESLYERIDRRVLLMMEAGLEEEAQRVYRLCREAYQEGRTEWEPEALTALQAIGYKEWLPVWTGACRVEEAVALIQQRSRNYAKRQLTWFRKQHDWRWLDGATGRTLDYV